jgi:hypothetical protein
VDSASGGIEASPPDKLSLEFAHEAGSEKHAFAVITTVGFGAGADSCDLDGSARAAMNANVVATDLSWFMIVKPTLLKSNPGILD